jgi:ABC-type glycerol-3-phosphate transport system substrate-binding protein
MGTAYNINRSTDILSLLMMQRGAEMNGGDNNNVSFNKPTQSGGQYSYPGESALNFYTQFSSTRGMAYSWNPLLHNSIDAFGEGTLAMMFNYSWQLATIRAKSPKLNFAVASIPQLSNALPINYANYWGYAVAKNKTIDPASKATNEQRISEAWRFITYLTANSVGNINNFNSGKGKAIDAKFDPAKVYLEKTKQPAARRDIIDLQKGDTDLGVFVSGNILAKSWWQNDPDAIEAIFAEMIDNVNKGRFSPREALDTATAKINKNQ